MLLSAGAVKRRTESHPTCLEFEKGVRKNVPQGIWTGKLHDA